MVGINGRIFEFPITGVGRFCYEVISSMDSMVKKDKLCLLLSKGNKAEFKLKNISIKHIGTHEGIYWEQVELPSYLHKSKMSCLSMSSSVPIFKHDYTLIHDISLKVNRYSNASISDRMKLWWPLFQYRVGIKTSRVVFTDTLFQKNEMIREYNLDPSRIDVVYAGWQHMNRIEEKNDVLERIGVSDKEYFFALSTRSKNKNFRWILEVAKRNPNYTFVISGKLDNKYFTDETSFQSTTNIITTGYITDSEIKALMKHAIAFIYPSIYEGFGLPPIEAISLGTKAIVGASSCLPEVYGDSVLYVDPYNYDVDLNLLTSKDVLCERSILNKYSWDNTAHRILAKIEIQEDDNIIENVLL